MSYGSNNGSRASETASGYNLSLDAFNALKSHWFLYSGWIMVVIDKRTLSRFGDDLKTNWKKRRVGKDEFSYLFFEPGYALTATLTAWVGK